MKSRAVEARSGETARAERRRYERERVRERAWFATPARTLYSRVWEISESGLSTRVATPFSQGEELTVSLGRTVRARARVVWTEPRTTEGAGGGMGLEFVEVLEGADELAQIIAEARRRARPPTPAPGRP